ncbi:PadR family transcriptional regulator [Dictyobacter kobayashii]|nr:PadR family transcriptional regulator [Dictyobacter kobayashii]
MYKQVMLLGVLLEKPMYGQQIREFIEAHHDLFANHIKKPTIYYQLERLVADGYLEIRRETVEAPGPGAAHEDVALRERDVYYITEQGKDYFSTLLRDMISKFTPGLSEVDACLYFLHHLTAEEACKLLHERFLLVEAYHSTVVQMMASNHTSDAAHQLVNDHKLTLLEAEMRWLKHTIEQIRTGALQFPPTAPATHSALATNSID